MSEDYKATLHTRGFGVELDIKVPDSISPVIVAQDVFGEKEERLQVLLYPADADDGGEVFVRFNRDGTLAEVVVPDDATVRRVSDPAVSPWMIERDGV